MDSGSVALDAGRGRAEMIHASAPTGHYRSQRLSDHGLIIAT
jgi:hypothetical protein